MLGLYGFYVYLRAGGVPTRHTHKLDGLHTRHLLESTHTNLLYTFSKKHKLPRIASPASRCKNVSCSGKQALTIA